MPLGMEIGLVSGDFVLDGDPAPPSPKRERSPLNFSAHVHCGQTAGWIKMILGTEVGLSSGDFVLHGDQAPSPNVFGPFLLWPNGWMHEDATWYGGRPQPRGLCDRWGPSPLNFRPMFIIVIVISLDHCTVVIGLFKFKFKV